MLCCGGCQFLSEPGRPFGKTTVAFQVVEHNLQRNSPLLKDLLELFKVGDFGGAPAALTAGAFRGAPGIAAGTGHGAEARLAMFKKTDMAGGSAFHAYRVIGMTDLFADNEVGDDPFDVTLVNGTAEYLQVHLDQGMQREHLGQGRHGNGAVAVDQPAGPVAVAESVAKLVDAAKTGTAAESHQGGRSGSYLLQLRHLFRTAYAALDKGDIILVGGGGHGLTKGDNFQEIQEIEQVVLVVEQLQLAPFAGGELKEGNPGTWEVPAQV